MVERADRGPGASREGQGRGVPEPAVPSFSERSYRTQRNARLDHVLKRIWSNGMVSLSEAELAFLDRVSSELRYELGISGDRPGYGEDEDG